MSYLQLSSGIPSFSKATFSLWFRIPQKSIDAAAARYTEEFPIPLFNGVIPLIVFGSSAKYKLYEAVFVPQTGTYTITHYRYDQFTDAWIYDFTSVVNYPDLFQWRATGQEFNIEPSYIGVFCKGGRAVLDVNIQMGDSADVESATWQNQTDINITDRVDYRQHISGGPIHSPDNAATTTITYENADVATNAAPERFRTLPEGADGFGRHVTSDRWHHILLSFDIGRVETRGSNAPGGSVEYFGSVINASRMWIAFDNRNLTGKQMSYYWPPGGGPNDILTPMAYEILYSNIPPDEPPFDDQRGNMVSTVTVGYKTPTYNYTPKSIPVVDKPLGIPVSIHEAAYEETVELAEFQMFIGVAMDTGNASIRHAFVSDGKPVSPAGTETSLGIKQLNREPDILLHGVGNWKQGRNTGSLPVQFQHFGTINKFKPEPKLGA